MSHVLHCLMTRRGQKNPTHKGTGSWPAVPPFFPPCGELSERCNGRDPAGARLASPRRLHAEFGPHWPPVLHRHRLARAVAEPTAALQRLLGRIVSGHKRGVKRRLDRR